MKRIVLALLLALTVWPSIASAHDVPDHVRISVIMKPANGKMQFLVRVPANALIDFLFPTQSVGNYLDLPNADAMSMEAARVWIADLLRLTENGAAMARPEVRAIRLSRVNDPSFNTFENALARVNGARMAPDTLVTQDQVTVDALLDAPIADAGSTFAFEPRFGRLGVVVNTTLTFLPADGGARQFQYDGDPETFELDPGRRHALRRFTAAGVTRFFGDTDYLLFALCAALVFQRRRALAPFVVVLALVQSLVLIASLALMPPVPWLRGLCEVLIAAVTVYAGIEAIVAGESRRVWFAIVAGVVLGYGFWIDLQPTVQFGGIHRLAAGLGFNLGLVTAELATVMAALVAVVIVRRMSKAPRAVVVIVAALAIHVSWRRLLERADALALTPLNPSVANALLIVMIGMGVALALAAAAAYSLRSGQQQQA
jgi:hypothetical protein